MAPSAKELCLGTLEDYDGKKATFQAWIRFVKLYLLVNEKIYDTNQKKITFALLFMKKGSVLGWATTFTFNTINNNKFRIFADFKNFLIKAFLTTNLKTKALACLQSIT